MGFSDLAIVYVKGNAYRIHFWYISKDDAITIMNNSNLIDKKGVLWFFLLYIKKWVRRHIVEETEMWYYIEQKISMNTIKNILREQARDKYRNLSEEEKQKKERTWKKPIC